MLQGKTLIRLRLGKEYPKIKRKHSMLFILFFQSIFRFMAKLKGRVLLPMPYAHPPPLPTSSTRGCICYKMMNLH